MGCDTKGVVATEEKNPHTIFRTIKYAIFNEAKRETGIDNVTAVWVDGYSMPTCRLSDIDGLINVEFKFAGESRDMSVITSCDHDYEDVVPGNKIILSLGAWGQSVRFIEIALRALSDLGKTYIWENDCESDWKPITFESVLVESKKEVVTW
jgi:hypothetical protein